MAISGRIQIGIVSCALFAGTIAAQTGADRLRMDGDFVTSAAGGGMAEVTLGKLAQDHASSDAVKEFGLRMVSDHTKANEELTALATKKGLTIPADLDREAKATLERLSALNGPAFDLAYMQDMVKDHQADVAEFKKEAKSGSDPDVKAFASKTLPTLQDHLAMAQQTLSGLKK